MDEEFERTSFSFYFNVMTYLGFWMIESDDAKKRTLYFLYSLAMNSWVVFMSFMGVLDFVHSVPDVNKVVYNVCINILIIGTHVKSQLIVHKAESINLLRRLLYRSPATCKDAEEMEIYANSVDDTRTLARIFLICLVVMYPFWFLVSLLSEYRGEREYPLPAKWPTDADIDDSKVFFPISVFHGVFAFYYLVQVVSIDASMFGLLAQINREYRFLIKKISEFGECCEVMYEETWKRSPEVGEINMFLKKQKVKQTLREIIARQKDLFKFTEYFEYGYNKSMFVHLFAGGTLLCVNGIQAMILSFNFNIKMAYEAVYVSVILLDILYLCWMTNRISVKVRTFPLFAGHRVISHVALYGHCRPLRRRLKERQRMFRCFEVGNAFYTIPWYKLDTDIQKDISFVIFRSQKPPRITSGNFVELNLQTSMVLLKNIYSWLALFRQVALK